MIQLILILTLILALAAMTVYTFYIRTCECPTCENEAVINLQYDYPFGEQPQKPISAAATSGVKERAGSKWDFLWS